MPVRIEVPAAAVVGLVGLDGRQDMRLEVGKANDNDQELVEKTTRPSTTHAYARIWVMRCRRCDRLYGSNSCDAHIRRCPYHDPQAAKGEPI